MGDKGDTEEKNLLEARLILERSSSVTVLSGAGISAESGVPTFRGTDGLWRNFRSENLATPEAFWENPRLVWEWYDWRRCAVKDARPNPGHFALAELENQKKKFTLVTQNIDGLHQMAGSRNVLEMHGNLWEIKCTKCGLITKDYRVPLEELPPLCPSCGGM